METPIVPDDSSERTNPAGGRTAITDTKFERSVRPIAEFVGRPDFPNCAYGEFVDIGGYAGVVIEVTNKSIRVRSPEETTQSFNIHVLRRLYSPRPEPEAEAPGRILQLPPSVAEADIVAKAPPERLVITEPDFNRPARPITALAGRLDFPKCAFGEFVAIADFSGVIIEIANESLRVKSPHGIIRSYGVSTLRKLYGQG